MHIVIMGCGRVGSALARSLEKRQHTVAVIDRDQTAFRRLGPEFGGRTIAGVGFDRDTLVEAGIEQADAFAAVSSGDNSNIISARVARETFGVKNVVARIYDPKRAEVYERLGIPTVATVRWTADRMLRALDPEGTLLTWQDRTSSVGIAEIPFHTGWIGQQLSRMEKETGARVALLHRFGKGMLPTPSTVLQEGDAVFVLVDDEIIKQVTAVAAEPPEAS